MYRARLAFVLMLAALCALPQSAGAVLSGTNGRIMFVSGRDVGTAQAGLWMREVVGSQGAGGVFPAVAPVGGQQHRHPSWAPDRTKVVFARGPGGATGYEIHIASLTEVADTTITDTTDNITADRPAWSPDGTRIAWEEGATTGNTQTDIVVYSVATGIKTNLTQSSGVREGKPAWSPDSQTIFYHRDQNGGSAGPTQLNIVSRPASGGTETLRVADSSVSEFQASISPDGTKICFTLQPSDSASAETLVANLTIPPDPGPTILTNDDGTGPGNPNLGNYNCTWSPDGVWVTYVRGIFNNGDLVMEHADNSDLTPIILEDTLNEFDGNPDWAPDGPPKCNDTRTQAIQGKPTRIRLPCHDTGPAYERSNVTETVPGDAGPFKGKVGTVTQGNPATVLYTPNPKYVGVDTFEFAGLNRGASDRGLATILVLKKGPCANMKTGNEKRNNLDGTIAGDRLLGLGAKDRLRGFKANDCLFGGAGPDTLLGGPSKDKLMGEEGDDRLDGGGANDRLVGGKGKDKFIGGKGNDKVNSADGRKEDVACGAGKDDRVTADEDDTLHGCEHVTRK